MSRIEMIHVVSYMWLSHVSHMNESCLTYERVMFQDFEFTKGVHSQSPTYTYEWCISHIYLIQVICVNKSCLTFERVMARIEKIYVIHVDESCLTYERVMYHRNLSFPWMHFPFPTHTYGVATISKLLKVIGLFCGIWSLFQGFFAKDTCHFEEPTNRSHTHMNKSYHRHDWFMSFV